MNLRREQLAGALVVLLAVATVSEVPLRWCLLSLSGAPLAWWSVAPRTPRLAARHGRVGAHRVSVRR